MQARGESKSPFWMSGQLTGIGNLDLDVAAVHRRVVSVEGPLQPIKLVELDIGEALRPLQLAVLDDPNAHDATSVEEFLDGFHGRVVGEVPDVSGKGGPGGKRRGGKAAREAYTYAVRMRSNQVGIFLD